MNTSKEFKKQYNQWKLNQSSENQLNMMIETIIEIETEKSNINSYFDKLYTKETNQKGIKAEIFKFNEDTIGKGLDTLYEAIENETHGKVQKIGIVNYNLDNTTKPLVIKVYTDKLMAYPVPLILVFSGKINSLEILTDIQLYCGHESEWSIHFEDLDN